MNTSVPRLVRERPLWRHLAAFSRDLRFVLRSLGKSPGYTLAVVLTLALGVGAASAIFSVTDRALFRPLPYPEPERLVVFGYKTRHFNFVGSLIPVQLAAYREHARSFDAFAAIEWATVNFVADGQPTGVRVGRLSIEHLSLFGAIPAIGRTFLPGEDQPGADGVLVLSHQFWRERLHSDPAAVGRDVLLDGKPCRIVGVLPRDFHPPSMHGAELYQPLVLTVDPAHPFGRFMSVIGRLAPNTTIEQARAELAGLDLSVDVNTARALADRELRLVPLAESQRELSLGMIHWALLGAVGFLYALACTNAANLMLARVHGRRRELCVRLAIGGGRLALIRLIAVENLILTLLAGLGGVLVAQWMFPLLLHLGTAGLSSLELLNLDWRMLVFAVALIVVTGLLVSLPITWQIASADPTEGLKEGTGALGESRRQRRFRGAVVVVEAALAVVLLVGAGLLVRSVRRLQEIDHGFDLSNKVAVWLQLPPGAYQTWEARRGFFQQLEEQLRGVPSVQGVAITGVVPLVGTAGGFVKSPSGVEYNVSANPVSPGYQRLLGLPLIRGKWFDDAAPAGTPVVVLNETMARAWFGDEDPVGRMLSAPFRQNPETWLVVGVARDVREQTRAQPRPQLYYPYWQDQPHRRQNIASVLLRLSQPPDAAFGDALRRAVYAVNPLIAAMPPRELEQAAADQVARERFVLRVLQILAGLALGLSTLGLVAVMAYAVAQRTGEFGVRLALGAVPADLSRLVLGRGLRLASVGVVIGSGAAWGLTRFLQSLLYETSPLDPLVYGSVALVLLLAAALGCWWPARRAARADVATLLRAE